MFFYLSGGQFLIVKLLINNCYMICKTNMLSVCVQKYNPLFVFGSNHEYRTLALINQGLYMFYSIFHYGLL